MVLCEYPAVCTWVAGSEVCEGALAWAVSNFGATIPPQSAQGIQRFSIHGFCIRTRKHGLEYIIHSRSVQILHPHAQLLSLNPNPTHNHKVSGPLGYLGPRRLPLPRKDLIVLS